MQHFFSSYVCENSWEWTYNWNKISERWCEWGTSQQLGTEQATLVLLLTTSRSAKWTLAWSFEWANLSAPLELLMQHLISFRKISICHFILSCNNAQENSYGELDKSIPFGISSQLYLVRFWKRFWEILWEHYHLLLTSNQIGEWTCIWQYNLII